MYANKTIVYAGGCFDLFHVGHLNLLQKAKTLGDILIVGVSTDELVQSYKITRPVISLIDRIRIIESLNCVDIVVVQDKLADVDFLKELLVDIYVTGSDWKDMKDEPAGFAWIRENIEMAFLPRTEDVSSTTIKQELNLRELL